MSGRSSSGALRTVARRGGPVVAAGVLALARTWRIEVAGLENVVRARDRGRGVLYCFWHGRMLALAAVHARRGIGVLVSTHPDGAAAASIASPLGYVPFARARDGGTIGVRRMLRHAASGGDLALASDGDGRRGRAGPGAVELARLTGHAIVPVAASSRPAKRVASWDRFEIPWPGARVRIRYGRPLAVPPDARVPDRERIRTRLEESLRRLHEGDVGGRSRGGVAVIGR